MPPKPRIFRSILTALWDGADGAKAMPMVFATMFMVMLVNVAIFQARMPDPMQIQFGLPFIAELVANSLIMGMFTAPFAVLYHRRIILGEGGGLRRLASLKDRVADFYVVGVALHLAFVAPMAAIGVSTQSNISGWLIFICVIGFLIVVYISLRLSLLFPAIAINGAHSTVSSAFRRSRGLAWRLFIAEISIVLTAKAASAALVYLAGKLPPDLVQAAAIVLRASEHLLTMATAIAIASRFYIWRREADAAGSTEASGAEQLSL